jgi:hypothetical protein
VRQAQIFECVTPDPVMVAVEKHSECIAVAVDNLQPQHLVRNTRFFAHTS